MLSVQTSSLRRCGGRRRGLERTRHYPNLAADETSLHGFNSHGMRVVSNDKALIFRN